MDSTSPSIHRPQSDTLHSVLSFDFKIFAFLTAQWLSLERILGSISLSSFALAVRSSLMVGHSCCVWHFGDQTSLSWGEAGTQVSLSALVTTIFNKSLCLFIHQVLGGSSGAGDWRQSRTSAFVRGWSSDTAKVLANASFCLLIVEHVGARVTHSASPDWGQVSAFFVALKVNDVTLHLSQCHLAESNSYWLYRSCVKKLQKYLLFT